MRYCDVLHAKYIDKGFPNRTIPITPIRYADDAITILDQDTFETEVLILPEQDATEAFLASPSALRIAKRNLRKCNESSATTAKNCLKEVLDLTTPTKKIKINSPINLISPP